jgi:hypothetical protein
MRSRAVRPMPLGGGRRQPQLTPEAGSGGPANGGFPRRSRGLGRIANKTHPGNILTRRAAATARRIPRAGVVADTLLSLASGPRGQPPLFRLFSAGVRDQSPCAWLCSLTVASPEGGWPMRPGMGGSMGHSPPGRGACKRDQPRCAPPPLSRSPHKFQRPGIPRVT